MRYQTAFAFVLLLLLSTEIFAQAKEDKNVFDPKSKLTWLGLDFTKAKFIGDEDRFQAMEISELLKVWNELMLEEQKKYNIPRMLHRKTVDTDLDVTIKHNATLSLDHILTNDVKLTKRMNLDSVASIVSGYDFNGLSGNGIMFNVESFNKVEAMGYVWVTFVDMDHKTVLFTRRLSAKAAGVGLRNYWARPIFEIIEQINLSYYSQWSGRP